MSGSAKKLLHAAAGTAAAGGATYVEDVFATHLYTGNNANNHEINNGVDLSDGGLVWFKRRSASGDYWLVDSERGGTLALRSNSNVANYSQTGAYSFIQSFDDNGFTMGDQGDINNATDFVSWSFRKQEGFFDVVKFSTTGGGGTQAVSHNLGSIPGYIIIKKTSASQSWICWAKNQTSPNSNWWRNYGSIDNTSTMFDWGDDTGIASAPTSTTVTLGSYFTGATADYVMYFFAEGGSDDQIFGDDSDEAIIKCGTFTTGGTTADFYVDCGFEIGWGVFIRTNDGAGFLQYDEMRGFSHGFNSELYWNSNNAEGSENQTRVVPTATGFANLGGKFETNSTYQYIVIRRGPMKEPSAGTDVYIADESHASAYENPMFQGTFPVDMSYFFDSASSTGPYLGSRLTWKYNAQIDSNSSAPSETNHVWDYMSGWYNRGSGSDDNNIAHMFRRYPKVFDVVVYEGNGSGGNTSRSGLSHNLGVAPEMIIHKRLDSSSEWQVGAAPISKGGYLNLNNSFSTSFTPSNEFAATTFDVDGWIGEGNNNVSGGVYLCLLFASLSGISKVGTYTGTGSNFNVTDLGAPVRYLLVKRTDGTGGATAGHWGVFDSTVQGINTSGYDPFPYLSTADQSLTTNQDVIDQHSSGFTVKDDTNSGFNINGGTYLYLAIA